MRPIQKILLTNEDSRANITLDDKLSLLATKLADQSLGFVGATKALSEAIENNYRTNPEELQDAIYTIRSIALALNSAYKLGYNQKLREDFFEDNQEYESLMNMQQTPKLAKVVNLEDYR